MKPKNILTTERLILRTCKDSDLPLMAVISSDPLVIEYFPSTQDIAATQALIKYINRHYIKFSYSLYAVEKKHEFIGFVGLYHPTLPIPNFAPPKKASPWSRLAGDYRHNIGAKVTPLKQSKQYCIAPSQI